MNIETNLPLESLLNLILNHALSNIDAKAGSLMTVNQKRGILQIKARLGIPKKGRKGEPEYRLNGKSIASKAVRTKNIVVINELEAESEDNYIQSRSENRINSILSAPIIYNEAVIAVINADSEEKNFFTKTMEIKLKDIAKNVAPLIAERMSFIEALKEVSIELSKLPSEGDLDNVLQKISDVAVKSLGIDIVTLYEYDQKSDEFIIEKGGPKIGGSLKHESEMRTKVYKEDVPYKVLERREQPLFYKNVKQVDYLANNRTRMDKKLVPRFIKREDIKSMAAFLLPNRAYKDPKEEIVGVLFANYKKEHEFNVDEQDALATFADYAATAILNCRKEKLRREELKKMEKSKKAQQLKVVLDNIAKAVMGDFDQKGVLDNILKTTMKILQAEACSIYLAKEASPNIFECIAGAGFSEDIVGVAEYIEGEGLTGTIAKDGIDIIINNKSELKKYKSKKQWKGKFDNLQWGKNREFKNLIGAPIKIENKTIGVIKVENKTGSINLSFNEDDLESLRIIGTVIGLTIENVRLQNKIETQLKSISARAAHRINNQLANYASFEMDLKWALNDIYENKNVSEKLAEIDYLCKAIHRTTENLKVLVSEIQKFGKPIELDFQLSDINKIIRDESWYSRPDTNKYIIDTKDLDDGIPNILIDSNHFPETIKEIINNSIKTFEKYNIRNGIVRFHSKIVRQNGKKWVFISVDDNGPGFPEEFPIFDPYKTTNKDSTGLGLATVKEVIEKHEGKIYSKKSDALGGARIEIYLPISTKRK